MTKYLGEPSDVKELGRLRLMIMGYLSEHPNNGGCYKMEFDFGGIKKEFRDGIVFYSSGWGWRLRGDWEKVFQERLNSATVTKRHGGPNEPYEQFINVE